MIIKVSAIFDVNEGQLRVGENPLQYLTKRIDEAVSNDIIKAVIIEATLPSERSLILRKT